jgi:Right handed beta helix region
MLKATFIFALSLSLASAALAVSRPLQVEVSEPETMDASNRIQWQARIWNNDSVVVDVTLLLWPSVGPHAFLEMPEGCTKRDMGFFLEAQCTFSLAPRSSRDFNFTTQAESRIGTFGVNADALGGKTQVVDQGTAVFGHPYLVTTDNDRGPGSLRQAIEDINRDCTADSDPCSVIFNIDGPLPAEGYFTIRLQKALPEIVASNVSFDGRSEARYLGVANSAGPEVLLDGSEVTAGHGVASRGTTLDVRDLAVGGFPENGINFDVGSPTGAGLLTLRRVYLGVDATGLAALPNGYRGVQVSGGEIIIRDSILSANHRSGAWLWTSGEVTVSDCKVGVGADGVTPLGNGASGLFFHNPKPGYTMATARDNVIANNREAGIGLSLAAVGNFAENTIRNNGNGAIDVALDGPTLTTVFGNPGQGGIIGPPSITSARYENGVTTIEGHKNAAAGLVRVSDNIYIYANNSIHANGLAEAEELVGVLEDVREDTFTLRVNADLRGRYVDASQFTVYVYNFDDPAPGTSEVGPPRIVQ